LVSDSESGYDPTGGQSGAEFPESGSGAPYADDLSDPSGRPQGVADTTRQIAEEIREDYQRTSDELRNRLKQGANSLSDSTRELTNNVQGLARQAGEQVDRSATEMTEGIRDGYSRYSSPASDPASDLPSDLSNDAAPSTTIPASDHASALPSDPGREPSRATRSSQPWRPGSTGTYPAGELDQSRYPSTGAPSEIEPASYPETIGSESRFAPAYR
jgi:hypothetical protein